MSQSGGAIKQQFIGFPIVGISMWIRQVRLAGRGEGGGGERDDERETEPVMGEALRLFVFLFSLLGSLTGEGGKAVVVGRRGSVEEEEGYTKYGGKEDDGVPRGRRRSGGNKQAG